MFAFCQDGVETQVPKISTVSPSFTPFTIDITPPARSFSLALFMRYSAKCVAPVYGTEFVPIMGKKSLGAYIKRAIGATAGRIACRYHYAIQGARIPEIATSQTPD